MSEKVNRIETLHFKPNGRVPNSRFPVLIHRAAVPAGGGERSRRHDRRDVSAPRLAEQLA